MTDSKLLTAACNEWASRPADERYSSVQDMHNAMMRARKAARTSKPTPLSSMHVETEGATDLRLVGATGARATFTNYAFNQLASTVGAPGKYLATLPNDLAANALNHGIKSTELSDRVMLFNTDGGLRLDAMVSEKYGRVWNSDLTALLLKLEDAGWQVPPARPSSNARNSRPATEADVLAHSQGKSGLVIKPGDMIAPAGLYASDRDMFAFMVDETRTVKGPTGHDMARGFFLSQSEVGDKSIELCTFLYAFICGNHLVWGAENVSNFKTRHVGTSESVFGRYLGDMTKALGDYSNAAASTTEDSLKATFDLKLGKTKDEVVETVYAKRILPRRTAIAAYEVAESAPETGDVMSAWGMAQGITRLSQLEEHASKRVALDAAAGKVLALA